MDVLSLRLFLTLWLLCVLKRQHTYSPKSIVFTISSNTKTQSQSLKSKLPKDPRSNKIALRQRVIYISPRIVPPNHYRSIHCVTPLTRTSSVLNRNDRSRREPRVSHSDSRVPDPPGLWMIFSKCQWMRRHARVRGGRVLRETGCLVAKRGGKRSGTRQIVDFVDHLPRAGPTYAWDSYEITIRSLFDLFRFVGCGFSD